MADLIIPVVLFISIGVVISLGLYFRSRSKQEFLRTVSVAIKNGNELDAAFFERLGDNTDPRTRDFRRGVLSIAVGMAFGLVFLLSI